LDALHKYLQVKSVATPIYNSPWLWKTFIYDY
jgi:coniferyl-aldehyde dehydrogenase